MADWADQIAALLAQQRANDPNRVTPDPTMLLAGGSSVPQGMIPAAMDSVQNAGRYVDSLHGDAPTPQPANSVPAQPRQPMVPQVGETTGISTIMGEAALKKEAAKKLTPEQQLRLLRPDLFK